MIINILLALILIFTYLGGFFFDRRASLTHMSGIKKGRATAEYLAHLSMELLSAATIAVIILLNPAFSTLIISGTGMAWVVGTFFIGFIQSKSTSKPWYYIGNGKGNTVEVIFRLLSKLFKTDMQKLSLIVRLLIMIACIIAIVI